MVVPTETAVTNPVLSTVATEVSEDIHGFIAEGGAEPNKLDVVPKQADKLPDIVGKELTVKVAFT